MIYDAVIQHMFWASVFVGFSLFVLLVGIVEWVLRRKGKL